MLVGIFSITERFSNPGLMSFLLGLKKSNVKYFLTDVLNGYIPCDISVTYSGECNTWLGAANMEIYKHSKKNLVYEGGFINRDLGYKAFGWGTRICNLLDFNNDNMSDDRLKKLNIDIKPQQITGKYILFCLQINNDANLYGIKYYKWILKVIKTLKKKTKRKIILRIHPKDTTEFIRKIEKVSCKDKQLFISKNLRLVDDLKLAFCVVTYNSNSAVEAIIFGIPVIIGSKASMAYSVSEKLTEKVDGPFFPSINKRYQWLSNLAYAQWNYNELSSGEAWQHIKKGIK